MEPRRAQSRARWWLGWGLGLGLGLGPGGCTSDEWPPLAEAGSSSDGAASGDDAAYDDARLEVSGPASAAIFELGHAVPLRARVHAPSGATLPEPADAGWMLDDGTIVLDGLEGDVELPAGVHDLRAFARLPNGDRLETTVGDVRVQARWTGVYEGEVELTVALDLPGVPMTPRCVGPLDLRVGFDGREVEVPEGTCSLDVFGQTFEGTYAVVDVVVYPAGLVRGVVDFDFDSPLGPIAFPIEWAGAFYDDRFSAGLSDTVALGPVGQAEVSGSLQATRVDRYLDPEE